MGNRARAEPNRGITESEGGAWTVERRKPNQGKRNGAHGRPGLSGSWQEGSKEEDGEEICAHRREERKMSGKEGRRKRDDGRN